MQMIDVHLPTTDGRELVLTRYTEPEPELSLLLKKLKLELPAQPPPKITAGASAADPAVVPTFGGPLSNLRYLCLKSARIGEVGLTLNLEEAIVGFWLPGQRNISLKTPVPSAACWSRR